VRIALWVLPFRILQKWAAKLTPEERTGGAEDRKSIYNVVWAISAAARRVPRASCLTQALAAQVMLGRRGFHTSLQLGVMKNEAGNLDAHAWVERKGEILIGFNDSFDQLTRLGAMHPEPK
jgi:hypothetical protein